MSMAPGRTPSSAAGTSTCSRSCPDGGPWGLGRAGRDWPASVREVALAALDAGQRGRRRPSTAGGNRGGGQGPGPPPRTRPAGRVRGTQHPQGRLPLHPAPAGRPAQHPGGPRDPLQRARLGQRLGARVGDRARHPGPRAALHRRTAGAGRRGQRARPPRPGDRNRPAAGLRRGGAAAGLRDEDRGPGRRRRASDAPGSRSAET